MPSSARKPTGIDDRPVDDTTKYARDVVAGRIVAGKQVRQSCQRHLNDLKRSREDPSYPFEFVPLTRAQTAIAFFELLPHTKGEWAGSPLTLQPWQRFIIGSVFGWLHRGTTLRRFRMAYVQVARKNGKSTLAGGLTIKLAFFDDEPGAEVYCAATKKDQAKIVGGEARRMVMRTRSLKRRIRVLVNNLSDASSGSKLEPLGADASNLDGLNTHAYLLDELHAHKTSAMVDVMETSTSARRHPLGFAITTAGIGRENICWRWHDYSRKVVEGVIEDDTWFAYVAQIDDTDNWEDERCWVKANPNLGVSVKIDDLRRKAAKAKVMPAAMNAFLRLHLDRWTEQSVRLIALEHWDKCDPRRDERDLRGRECWGGLDLASVSDLAAFALWFPDESLDAGDLLMWFWCPESAVEQRTGRDRVPYAQWVKDGLITATLGDVTDYAFIRDKVKRLSGEYQIRQIAYDPWNGTQLASELMEDGADVLKFGQGFASMAAPVKEILRLVGAHRFRHGGHPVLRWMAEHVAGKMDPAGNIKFDRSTSSEKIDGLVAAAMAVGAAALKGGEPTKKSIYETRGLTLVGGGDD